MNGSTADRSTPSGARSDSSDATPPTSVGEDRADFRASDDAEELTRSSIFTDRFKNACVRACRALSTEGIGVLSALANAAVLRLDLIRLLSFVVYHVHGATEQTRATETTRWRNLASKARLLAFESRTQIDAFLKEHEIFDYSASDFEQDRETLRQLRVKEAQH
jgi:hypothetical protein